LVIVVLRALSLSISWGVPGDIAGHPRLAGRLEVLGRDDNMLAHGYQVLALDDEFGHRVSPI
jgi:hypothetical protein